MTGLHRRIGASAFSLGLSFANAVVAQETPGGSNPVAARPVPSLIRYEEDWSSLADPASRTAPFDDVKYVGLDSDPRDFLSLGANVRGRYEVRNAFLFGTAGSRNDAYALWRTQVHADLRFADRWQVFVQLEDIGAGGLRDISPADSNKLDLRQAFVAAHGEVGAGRWAVRAGRQEIAFDLERFVSVREGPNVRQAFDGVVAEYAIDRSTARVFATRPVQYRDQRTFDDVSNRHLSFSGIRGEQKAWGLGDISAYAARYTRDQARVAGVVGNETRNVVDVRYFRGKGPLQFDLEGMVQQGSIADRRILAWAVGARTRYTFAEVALRPAIGLQFDAASGDRGQSSGTVRAFNPLFPNGLYFTQAGFTGYSNLIHVKPSLTLSLLPVTLYGAVASQFRQTTQDAVYAQPDIPIPGTAGRGGRHTGEYAQARAEWRVNANVKASLEGVHFKVSDSIRDAGGRNANYAGLEIGLAF